MEKQTCKDQAQETPSVDVGELESLGFTTAARTLDAKKTLAKKLMFAYEHYRFVTQDHIDKFTKALKEKTYKNAKDIGRYHDEYDTLKFVNISQYEDIPPATVLQDLRTAQLRGCFDTFEVAKVASVEVRPDPIIFGVIKGCKDRFFISQWDNDVRIEDLIGENEG